MAKVKSARVIKDEQGAGIQTINKKKVSKAEFKRVLGPTATKLQKDAKKNPLKLQRAGMKKGTNIAPGTTTKTKSRSPKKKGK